MQPSLQQTLPQEKPAISAKFNSAPPVSIISAESAKQGFQSKRNAPKSLFSFLIRMGLFSTVPGFSRLDLSASRQYRIPLQVFNIAFRDSVLQKLSLCFAALRAEFRYLPIRKFISAICTFVCTRSTAFRTEFSGVPFMSVLARPAFRAVLCFVR